jgi:hypothetical protein
VYRLGYGQDGPGFESLYVKEIVSSPQRPDRLCGPRSWYRGYLSGVKRPGRDANHLSPSSAEFKNEWRHTSTHPMCFNRVNFTCNTAEFVLRYVYRLHGCDVM